MNLDLQATWGIIAQPQRDKGRFSASRITKKPHAQCTGLDCLYALAKLTGVGGCLRLLLSLNLGHVLFSAQLRFFVVHPRTFRKKSKAAIFKGKPHWYMSAPV